MSQDPPPSRGPKLTAYRLASDNPVEIRPAPLERDWMNATNERFAYRCLPLNIANAHGWELINPVSFSAGWTGENGTDAILIGAEGGATAPAVSHFGYGVLTFHVPLLFRTEPGWDLMVQGPVNRPKDGVSALAGVVETDWAPFSFTMNWAFTRPGTLIRFAAGEPFCHLFPVRRGELESMAPELLDISVEPELKAQYEAWSRDRDGFNADLHRAGSAAQAERWQKNYYKGLDPEGRPAAADDHRTRVRLKPFKKA